MCCWLPPVCTAALHCWIAVAVPGGCCTTSKLSNHLVAEHPPCTVVCCGHAVGDLGATTTRVATAGAGAGELQEMPARVSVLLIDPVDQWSGIATSMKACCQAVKLDGRVCMLTQPTQARCCTTREKTVAGDAHIAPSTSSPEARMLFLPFRRQPCPARLAGTPVCTFSAFLPLKKSEAHVHS